MKNIVRKTEQLETAIKLDARSIRVVSIARYLLQHLSQVAQV